MRQHWDSVELTCTDTTRTKHTLWPPRPGTRTQISSWTPEPTRLKPSDFEANACSAVSGTGRVSCLSSSTEQKYIRKLNQTLSLKQSWDKPGAAALTAASRVITDPFPPFSMENLQMTQKIHWLSIITWHQHQLKERDATIKCFSDFISRNVIWGLQSLSPTTSKTRRARQLRYSHTGLNAATTHLKPLIQTKVADF